MAPMIGDTNTQANGTTSRGSWDAKDFQDWLQKDASPHQNPLLRIDITNIQERAAKFRDREIESEPSSNQLSSRPIPASCSLTIWDFWQNTLVEQTRPCWIHPNITTDYGRNAVIKLNAPFEVPLKQLKTIAKPNGAGEMTYSTQFVLLSVDETSKWPPFDLQIPKPRNARVRDQGSKFVRAPLLVAKWTRLPYLPEIERETLMEIKASQDGHIYKPKLSLKFSAEWVDVESPLAKYNQQMLPTNEKLNASSLARSAMSKARILTEWIFKGILNYMPKVVLHGWICPLCHGRRFRGPGEYHYHLEHSHELLKFEYSLALHTNESKQSVASIVVEVGVAETHHALIDLESRNLAWIKPQRPLDLEAYLRGDDSWVKNQPEPARQPSAAASGAERSVSRDQDLDDAKNGRKRAIDDIPEVIVRKKRKFKVPPAPNGFRYYNVVSKVPLVEGDEMSESDDDVSETWLLQKHADTIDSFSDITSEEKLFMCRFDKHMLSENPCSDTHLEEALIRFCKQNKAWLQRPSMKLELTKRLTALYINRPIAHDVLRACLQIVNNESVSKEKASPLPNSDACRKGMRSDGEVRRAYHLEVDHIYGECGICWEVIYDKSQLQYCINSACIWKSYHIRCAHESPDSKRSSNWLCLECESRGVRLGAVPAKVKSLKLRRKSTIEASDSTSKATAKKAPLSSSDIEPAPSAVKGGPPAEPVKISKTIPTHLRSPTKTVTQTQLQSQTQAKPISPRLHKSINGILNKENSRSRVKPQKVRKIIIESDGSPWEDSSADDDSDKLDGMNMDPRAKEDAEYVDSDSPWDEEGSDF